ncbi:hypothetical protein NCS56_01423900 [Fusarium sp. Ph1]|nr:hypothetical protein NCS56_01423900 [Fusarium sp. Ph1]
MGPTAAPSRVKKTDITRRRTGCQTCRHRRRKCDETRPKCLSCVQRGVECGGYERRIAFKDVSAATADYSKRIEEARWSALRLRDANKKKAREKHPAAKPLMPQDGEAETQQQLSEQDDDDQTDSELNLGGGSDPESPIPLQQPQCSLPPSRSLAAISALDCQNLEQNTGMAESSLNIAFSPSRINFDTALDFLVQSPFTEAQGEATPADQVDDTPTVLTSPFPMPQAVEGTNNETLELLHDTDEVSMMNLSLHRQSFEDDSSLRDNLALASMPWSSLLMTREDDQLTPLDMPCPHPAQTPSLSVPTENVLLQNFEIHLAPTIFGERTPLNMLQAGKSLRAAALALSVSHMELGHDSITQSLRLSPSDGLRYYDLAMRDMAHRLEQPGRHHDEQLVGTTLLLAYRDLVVGSIRDVQHHLRKLQFIMSNSKRMSAHAMALFKASRILQYDFRLTRNPTRKSTTAIDASELQGLLDPQLAIRDILARLTHLYGRYSMEASFRSGDGGYGEVGASSKAVQWIQQMLNRQCDFRQFQQRDYHDKDLTAEELQDQFDILSQRLDAWHHGLCDHDMPRPNLGTEEDFVVANPLGTIMTFRFASEHRAVDYLLYLLSRLICSRLQSILRGKRINAHGQAWGRVMLGIMASMDVERQKISFHSIENLLITMIEVSEGTDLPMAILHTFIPRFSSSCWNAQGAASWAFVRQTAELVIRERLRGKDVWSVLVARDDYETDKDWYAACNRRAVVFGHDSSGIGFRELHFLQ